MSASPGSSEPWCATLRISTSGRSEPCSDVGFSVGREEDVGRAVRGEEDDRVEVGVLARRPRVDRPEGAQDESARPKGRTRAHDSHGYVVCSCGTNRLFALGSGRLEVRVEHLPDVEAAQDVVRPSHVVALRMGEDESRERPNAHVDELRCGIAFRWALIDENAGTRCLEEHGVPLTDVEERHAKPRWWGPCRRCVCGEPCGRRDDDDTAQRERDEHAARASQHGVAVERRATSPRRWPRPSPASECRPARAEDRRRPERRARARPQPTLRVPRDPQLLRAIRGRRPPRGARAPGRAVLRRTRRRSRGPCRAAPRRSGTGRSEP